MTKKKALTHWHRATLHLSKRKNRMMWAFLIGGTSLVAFALFHVEICKFFAEISCVPAMESLIGGAEE